MFKVFCFADWLQSRRHCAKDWQQQVYAIREKINRAIQDMPEHQEIVDMLSGICKLENPTFFEQTYQEIFL